MYIYMYIYVYMEKQTCSWPPTRLGVKSQVLKAARQVHSFQAVDVETVAEDQALETLRQVYSFQVLSKVSTKGQALKTAG